MDKKKKIILISTGILIVIIIGVIIGYVVYKHPEDNNEYNISKLTQTEAKEAIINSSNTEDLICSIPEYTNEKILDEEGINYVYCYLKYNRSDNDEFSISYNVLDDMIFQNFNVSIKGIKSILNENNEYTYGSQSAYWGNIFLKNNYNQDTIEIKIEITHPLESIIEFSYNDQLNSYIKLDDITYFGNYIYTTSEKDGKYDIYKYNNNNKKYDLVSNYQCKEITHTTNYYSEYGKYKEVDSCLANYSSNGFMIFSDNYSLLDMSSGKTWNYDKYYLLIENKGGASQDYSQFIVVEKDGKYGIIKSNGDIIADLKYEQFGDTSDNNTIVNELKQNYYSTENDIIIFKDNNKYGLMKISNGNIIVPANNEYLKLFIIGTEINNEYYKVYNDGKWTMYDFQSNNIVYEDANADDIYYVNDDLIIVREKEKIYLKDFNGNLLTDSTIDIASYVDDNKTNFECDNIDYSLDGDLLKIEVLPYNQCSCYGECIYEGSSDEYLYNIKTGTLDKKAFTVAE